MAKKAKKFDKGKSALGYLPPLAMLEVGFPFLAGEKKYGAFNYMHGFGVIRLVSGALRHIFQYLSGETYDRDSSKRVGRPVHHLACAVANLLIALENVLRDPKRDDRYKP